jgi:hypothetical protein
MRRMPCYIQVLFRLCLFATLDLILRCDQSFDFLCSARLAQVSYYVNKKSECFPLQFVVYLVTVLKFEAIFLLVWISKPTIYFLKSWKWRYQSCITERYGNDIFFTRDSIEMRRNLLVDLLGHERNEYRRNINLAASRKGLYSRCRPLSDCVNFTNFVF